MPSDATWQYCRYCLGSIATGSRSGHRPHALPDRLFVRDQPVPRHDMDALRRRALATASCGEARMRAPSADRERVAHDRGLNPGQSLAGAGCQSASRWQYCQAVSAVLPEVARRHPATPSSRHTTVPPSSRHTTEPPSSRNATGPPSSRDATVPPRPRAPPTTDDAYSRTT
jgi:hypothetical protein